MRVGQYLKEKNIGLSSLNMVCEYLHLDKMKVTSKLSEIKIELFDEALNNQSFKEWFQVKLNLDRLEINNAINLVRNLYHYSTTEITETLAERILNALNFLNKRVFYSSKVENNLNQIIQSNNSVLDKISTLRNSEPFVKPKETTKVNEVTKPKKNRLTRNTYRSKYDPYENFYWGGLSGEEAFIGYWNTD